MEMARSGFFFSFTRFKRRRHFDVFVSVRNLFRRSTYLFRFSFFFLSFSLIFGSERDGAQKARRRRAGRVARRETPKGGAGFVLRPTCRWTIGADRRRLDRPDRRTPGPARADKNRPVMNAPTARPPPFVSLVSLSAEPRATNQNRYDSLKTAINIQ